jgi:hypothetical protein
MPIPLPINWFGKALKNRRKIQARRCFRPVITNRALWQFTFRFDGCGNIDEPIAHQSLKCFTCHQKIGTAIRANASGDGSGGGKAQGLSLAKLQENPHGIDLGALQPSLKQRICTSDGKIALAPHIYLAELSRARLALASFKPRNSSEFVVIGRRHVRSNNSWLHNSLPLVKGKNRCTMMINSQDAHALNVQEGEMVRVQSRVGEITIPVELCDDIMRGVISIPHGFGHNREGTQLSIAEGKAA